MKNYLLKYKQSQRSPYGEYDVNHDDSPLFCIVEEADLVPASKIIERFEMDERLTPVKDYFKDNILYRGSVDGSACSFHQRCDNKGPTLTLIRCTCNYIFGGYASEPWTSTGNYSVANNSFLFTLKNPSDSPPTKFDVVNGNANAICGRIGQGPIFGGGHDLMIGNSWQGCYLNFPTSFTDTTGRGNATFTGTRNFTSAEVPIVQTLIWSIHVVSI